MSDDTDLVQVAYSGPSGALLVDGFTVLQGGLAMWPRASATRVMAMLPEHGLTIVPDEKPATKAKAADVVDVETGSVASDSAHLIASDTPPPE